MTARPFDLVLREARICRMGDSRRDIGIRDGKIAAIAQRIAADCPGIELAGRLVTPGFVEAHIHLDKSCLAERCGQADGLRDAVRQVTALKPSVTVEDVYARGRRTLERAIVQGTTRMRTHVEVDPLIGLRGFEAVKGLRRDYAWAVDIEICVFPQDGLFNNPGTEELLVRALGEGADLLGGCPYTDSDPPGQIRRLFELANAHGVDIDFHLDFDLDPAQTDLPEVCSQTERHGMEGRVTVGHVTKLSAMPPKRVEEVASALAGAGISVVALPSTDLFLTGRGEDRLVPRGVAPVHRLGRLGVNCAIASNNVLNPFTPFGDCSLLRMANLYANVAQIGSAAGLAACFDMITLGPARLVGQPECAVRVGSDADLVVIDAVSPEAAVAEITQPICGFKRGRKTFFRAPATLYGPVPGPDLNQVG